LALKLSRNKEIEQENKQEQAEGKVPGRMSNAILIEVIPLIFK
jgi:hypothetical protein